MSDDDVARAMPTMCKHGRVSDWGGFGTEGSKPEPCYYCRRGADRDELRDLVYRSMVNKARVNEGLREAIEPLGFFRFLDLVDGIVDSIQEAYETAVPLAEVASEDAPKR